MSCDRLAECREFLACYQRIGRGEIADRYATHYCHAAQPLTCKRREFFVNTGETPSLDLTPSGHFSLLQRFYREVPLP